ncbi:bifunctional folylpolyglutamate synthase/dihydrofolate synthase [Anaerotignum lactatifermentans]|uniref:tetrahydrofolate synthase n=1 Tax=Anaerotignum lactatifermentans TaxID=160404 RepID=A0ABS2G914_9FIRM|nr:folylpolyglutamate synthase/dihydrofolate synthase family protein [Anaerotignum lactatifermentans]MBM6828392.1 bifunctional folylpolyglutamate synthase/dihydrofolate synthase [Anaerotignum lactatifermentans]MBM6877672.1 bifunctional folylpolyglutamate synthase/dihydrofolate synthase [Anaerotignum lactatifermentans]MBM6949975.1 bifunctional folylpolyglutamate synthase/dihydrofolate synthase [Anaerotignum lactatifermentans]
MNYQQSIEYLEKEVGFASVPGLSRIKALLARMGNPQDQLTCIHIAGTNGKGSASALLSSILTVHGYRTAVYTSPHLEKYNERFRINGTDISDEDFAAEITLVRGFCEQMDAAGEEVPTLFEIVTAAAFHYFAQKKVDLAIIEVGLGGRYDATNVITAPLLSLIMSISIDHTAFLGDTIEEIAAEKCGIIKKNSPVVLYSQEKIVYNIAEAAAKSVGAPFYCETESVIHVTSQSMEETVFSVKNRLISYQDLHLPLLGNYQIQNCVTVLNACAVLQKQGLSLTEEGIREGVCRTKWAGRMEICGKDPLILLDGAHNADGIKQLASSLPAYAKDKKITLVLGVLGDKEYELMTSEIFPLIHQAILTEPANERKLDVRLLEKTVLAYGKPVYVEKEIEKACQKAKELTAKEGMILCCGSLYMIGEIRKLLCE